MALKKNYLCIKVIRMDVWPLEYVKEPVIEHNKVQEEEISF